MTHSRHLISWSKRDGDSVRGVNRADGTRYLLDFSGTGKVYVFANSILLGTRPSSADAKAMAEEHAGKRKNPLGGPLTIEHEANGNVVITHEAHANPRGGRRYRMTPDGEQPVWASKSSTAQMGREEAQRAVRQGGEPVHYGNTTYDAAAAAEFHRLTGRYPKWGRQNPRGGRDFYLTPSGKPLPASDIAFIKKCAQAMRPRYALKYTGWEAIAARPTEAAVLLAHKPNVEHALYAYAAANGGAHARGQAPAGYSPKAPRRNPPASGVDSSVSLQYARAMGTDWTQPAPPPQSGITKVSNPKRRRNPPSSGGDSQVSLQYAKAGGDMWVQHVLPNPAPGQHAWSSPKGSATCTKCGLKRKLEKKSGGWRTFYGVVGGGPKGGTAWSAGAPPCSGSPRANPKGSRKRNPERLYHVVVRNDKTGTDTYLTVTPENHHHAVTILSKQSPIRKSHKHLRYLLVEATPATNRYAKAGSGPSHRRSA